MSQIGEVAGYLAAGAVLVLFLVVCRRWPTSRGDVGMWAFAALTTVLLSPHLVVYDLVLLLPAVLYLLERQDTPTVRVALFFLFVITWMAPVGHLLAGPCHGRYRWSAPDGVPCRFSFYGSVRAPRPEISMDRATPQGEVAKRRP